LVYLHLNFLSYIIIVRYLYYIITIIIIIILFHKLVIIELYYKTTHPKYFSSLLESQGNTFHPYHFSFLFPNNNQYKMFFSKTISVNYSTLTFKIIPKLFFKILNSNSNKHTFFKLKILPTQEIYKVSTEASKNTISVQNSVIYHILTLDSNNNVIQFNPITCFLKVKSTSYMRT